jgi:aryl-alcohol dehydrogenase-like predicted oxidoreductase
MRYKLLGKSGLRVSELSLGTMTFGEDWGWGASKEESKRIFDHYAEAGGNFVDTSNNYTNGTSEKYVGEFMAPDRDHFVLATKYSLTERRTDPNFGGNHRKNLLRSVKASLERLQTDHLDLLWLHMWDYTTPLEEIMRTLDDLVRQGMVQYVGISDTPAWVVSQANMLAELRGWSPFVALQVPYSLASRDAERDLLPMAKSLGLSATPWGVIGQGLLTGKYNRDDDQPKREKREDYPAARLELAQRFVDFADSIERSPAQVAINWVRQQGPNVIPIVGARSQQQLQDNLGCLEFTLTPEQLQTLSGLNPIQLGFPHTFLSSDHVRGLIFGETFAKLDGR